MSRSIPVLAAFGLMAGCASYPVPVQRMADAQSTTTVAEQSGAHDVPQADLHLQLAKEEIHHARVLIHDKRTSAPLTCWCAPRPTPNLALAQANERTARVAARKVLDDISALRSVPSSTTTTTGQGIKP